jgi:hypothetical protein
MGNDKLTSYINASPRLPLISGQQDRSTGVDSRIGHSRWFLEPARNNPDDDIIRIENGWFRKEARPYRKDAASTNRSRQNFLTDILHPSL